MGKTLFFPSPQSRGRDPLFSLSHIQLWERPFFPGGASEARSAPRRERCGALQWAKGVPRARPIARFKPWRSATPKVRKDFTVSGYVFFPKGSFKDVEMLVVNTKSGSDPKP